MKTQIFWFTGLSGSGKSTVANAVKAQLESKNFKIDIVDGDAIRASYTKPLGFTKDDILENNQMIAKVCLEKVGYFDAILVPVISPYEEGRSLAKTILEDVPLWTVYFCANLESVAHRDVKGLYAKASRGEIKNMIGFCESSPYEFPINHDLKIDSSIGKETLQDSIKKLNDFVQTKLESQRT